MRFKKNEKNTTSKTSSSNLTNRGAIGIDISQDAIRMVQLSGRSLNQIQLEKYAITKLPKNIIKGNRIQDYDQLVSYLQHAYAQLRSNNRNIVVALPQNVTTIETVVYNSRDSEMDLPSYAEYEISQLAPLDEVNYDYQVIGRSSQPLGDKVLLVAARKEEIEPRLEVFESAGLNPSFMDIDIFAQTNAFSYWINQHSSELSTEKVALINIGEHEMHALIVQEGQILYKQESSISGEQLNQLIQRTYQTNEEQAANMLKNNDKPIDYQSQIADRFNIQVAQEIQRVLHFYYTTQQNEQFSSVYTYNGGFGSATQQNEQFSSVKHILITGSASQQLGLPETVFSQTNTATECVHPITYANTSNKLDLSELQQSAASLTVAFGLALRGL